MQQGLATDWRICPSFSGRISDMHPMGGSLQQFPVGADGRKRIIFRPFGIKMLAVPGVVVLKCHPYRQIPIVIHGFCLRHHLSVSTLTFGASSRMLALTRVLV